MAGNSFGEIFRITTFGESHGEGEGVVIDGCPSRINLSPEDFVLDMTRRRPGTNPFGTPRREEDRVEILSGVFEGLTTGAPITLFTRNKDVDSRPYEVLRNVFRPGHGDYTYFEKYGHFDFRGGGRYSSRETTARVAAGVVAGKILEPLGVKIVAYTLELGGIRVGSINLDLVDKNPLSCPDPVATKRMEEALSRARKKGDSLGGVVEIRATGCPAGLGEPVFDKLDADLSKAVMSIGTVKGVEIGAGFEAARLKGSENNDPLSAWNRIRLTEKDVRPSLSFLVGLTLLLFRVLFPCLRLWSRLSWQTIIYGQGHINYSKRRRQNVREKDSHGKDHGP